MQNQPLLSILMLHVRSKHNSKHSGKQRGHKMGAMRLGNVWDAMKLAPDDVRVATLPGVRWCGCVNASNLVQLCAKNVYSIHH